MDESSLNKILENDPGNSAFAELIGYLMSVGQNEKAVMVGLKGLSVNPSCHKGRLLLAKVFYKMGFIPFAIDQLNYLVDQFPDNKSILRLLDKLSPAEQGDLSHGRATNESQATVAEAEFDFSDIELIDEDNKG